MRPICLSVRESLSPTLTLAKFRFRLEKKISTVVNTVLRINKKVSHQDDVIGVNSSVKF